MRTWQTVLAAVGIAALMKGVEGGCLRGEPPASSRPPWQRLLQGDDAKKARELDQQVYRLSKAGKLAEALESAEAVARLRQERQGQDHWQAVDARLDAEVLRRVLRSDRKDQEEYAALFQVRDKADSLEQQERFREALPLRERIRALRRKVLGDDHSVTASSEADISFNLQSQGRYQEAEEGYQRALDIFRKRLGEDHPDTAATYNNVAYCKLVLGRYREAEKGFRQVLAIRRRVLGEDHERTASSHDNVAHAVEAQGRYREAAEGHEKALAIYRHLFGEEHPDTARSYSSVAANLVEQGRFKEAEAPFRKALEIRRKVFGEEHPETARSWNNLAFNLTTQGHSREGEEGFRKALNIYRRVLGEEHPSTATGYHNLAANLRKQGRYREAEEAFHKALDIYRKVFGDDHPKTAESYSGVAANLSEQGRYKEAEAGFRRALDIKRRVLGEEHPDTATSYNNLAVNLNAQGRYAAAEQEYRKALAIRRKVHGEEHPDTADTYHGIAFNLHAQGKYREAEEEYRKALAIYRKALGEEHPTTALTSNSLALNLHAQGRYPEAEEDSRKALAIRRKMLGEDHPDTAQSCNNLADNLNAQGRYSEAEALYQRGAEAFLTARLQVAASGLGRAARTSEQSPLLRLAALLARNGKPAEAWQRLEQGLGRGAWDDLSARLRRPAKELARQSELLAQLERVDLLLTRHSAQRERTPMWEKERSDLLDRRRQAHEELTKFQHHLEETYGPAQGQVFERPAIQAALAPETALVAWIDIAGSPKAADANGEHWAVLLRAQGQPIFERLRGSAPGGAWTEEDGSLPERLRTALHSAHGEWRALAARLGEQRLQPLRKHLSATDRLPVVRHLVVLPSVALAGVPLEVIAEDHTISYASSGTLYAHLRKQPALDSAGLLVLGDPVFDAAGVAKKEPLLPPGGLLLTLVQPGSNAAQAGLRLDDVLLRYGDTELKTPADMAPAKAAAPKGDVPVQVWREGTTFERRLHAGPLGVVLADRPAPQALLERARLQRLLATRSGDSDWKALPGTRVEVESLRRLFGAKPEPTVLTDSEASEQKLDDLAASGALSRYRYLHLATHGEVDDAWPLRSALILARDTLPDPQKQLLAGKPVYDGRLTAEQMLRSWNLHSELVTLSACQTALGKYERGEGYVGFAQALLLCGSRSVCLSLWKVDDAATALLMQRFYANLLGKRNGLKAALPKAAALREARQWLRTLSREEALRVAAEVSQGVERGKGRPKGTLLPALPEPVPAAKDDCPYAHPYYWAAFVLTGDPG
jgi:tetratricopeptide (TPR) repeat protein